MTGLTDQSRGKIGLTRPMTGLTDRSRGKKRLRLIDRRIFRISLHPYSSTVHSARICGMRSTTMYRIFTVYRIGIVYMLIIFDTHYLIRRYRLHIICAYRNDTLQASPYSPAMYFYVPSTHLYSTVRHAASLSVRTCIHCRWPMTPSVFTANDLWPPNQSFHVYLHGHLCSCHSNWNGTCIRPLRSIPFKFEWYMHIFVIHESTYAYTIQIWMVHPQ
jgi:hypothetical protein